MEGTVSVMGSDSRSPEDVLSHSIIGGAIEVHRVLGGPGLLEAVYEEALAWELTQKGHLVQRQVSLPVQYKDVMLGTPLRVDMMVDGLVIVECKSVVASLPVFQAQLLTYLRLTGLKLGLLINFGESSIRNGIHRVVNGL